MRLEKIQKVLKEKKFPYTYTEEDGCGGSPENDGGRILLSHRLV